MTDSDDVAFEGLLEHIRDQRAFDFTGYKRASLRRRVDKRMADIGVSGYEAYLETLEVDPDEFTALFNTILINVTRFFRDADAWAVVSRDVVPAILRDVGPDAPIRIWSAGCASGEEAYTLAMILADAMGDEAFRRRVKIYATDVDDDALATARQALYGDGAVADVPEELRQRYFDVEGDSWRFRADLRRRVIFGRHDLLQDAPISRLDLLVCRNVLMYFNSETQGRIVAQLSFALKPSGWLFLGRAEMLLSHSRYFRPYDLPHRVFTRATDGPRPPVEVPAAAGPEEGADRSDVTAAAFEESLVAQVVVGRDGTLTLANAVARETFGIDWSDLGRPFQDVAISFRPVELRAPIERCRAEGDDVVLEDVTHEVGGTTRTYEVTVRAVGSTGGSPAGVCVSFVDVSAATRLGTDLERSRRELELGMAELQSTSEELETTNEELQSTIEELETTNEELQSTNEELETLNEELQSTNDEQQAINDELGRRGQEVDLANAYLEAVLSAVGVAVIVVDADLRVRLWSDHAAELWGLRADETPGTSLAALDVGLPMDELLAPIRRCFQDEVTTEVDVSAHDRRGRTLDCRVRMVPFRLGRGADAAVTIVVDERARGSAPGHVR